MDEYISKDELLRAIFNLKVAEAHDERCAQLLEAILNAPTADVVPKAELDIFKSTITQKEEEAYNRGYADAKSEVMRGIFEEIERTFNAVLVGDISDILKVLAELKKKYTEQCPDCKHFVGCEKAVWTGPCKQYEERHTEE